MAAAKKTAKVSKVEFIATGRRKESIARVRLTPNGNGQIVFNKLPLDDYFKLGTNKLVVNQPLTLTNTADKYDIKVNVKGGGLTGQAGAIRHGIARSLLQANSEYRPILKSSGFLTRDARMKERKKYVTQNKIKQSKTK